MKTKLFKSFRQDTGEVYETFTLQRLQSGLFKQVTVSNLHEPGLVGTWLICRNLSYYRSLFKVPVKILPI